MVIGGKEIASLLTNISKEFVAANYTRQLIDYSQLDKALQCFNEVSTPDDRKVQTEVHMVSAIILSLAVLTAGLVIGVFVMALNELNQIDEIASGKSDYCAGSDALPLQVGAASPSQI